MIIHKIRECLRRERCYRIHECFSYFDKQGKSYLVTADFISQAVDLITKYLGEDKSNEVVKLAHGMERDGKISFHQFWEAFEVDYHDKSKQTWSPGEEGEIVKVDLSFEGISGLKNERSVVDIGKNRVLVEKVEEVSDAIVDDLVKQEIDSDELAFLFEDKSEQEFMDNQDEGLPLQTSEGENILFSADPTQKICFDESDLESFPEEDKSIQREEREEEETVDEKIKFLESRLSGELNEEGVKSGDDANVDPDVSSLQVEKIAELFRSQLGEKDRKIQAMAKMIEDLKSEVLGGNQKVQMLNESARKNSENYENEIEKVSQELKAKELECDSLNKNLKDSQSQIESLNNRIGDMNEQIQELRSFGKQKSEGFREILQTCKEDLSKAKVELEERKIKIDRLEDSNVELQRENDMYSDQISVLKERIYNLENVSGEIYHSPKHEEIELYNKNIQVKVDSSDEKSLIKFLEYALGDEREKSIKLKESSDELTEKNKELCLLVQRLRSENQMLEMHSEDYKTCRDTKEAEFKRLQMLFEQSQETLTLSNSKLVRENEELKQRAQNAYKLVKNRVKDEVRVMMEEMKQLSSDRKKLRRQNQLYKDQIAYLKDEFTNR